MSDSLARRVKNNPSPMPLPRRGRGRRALLWGALVLLLLVAQSLLLVLTINYEANRRQEAVDAVAVDVAADVRHEMLRAMQLLQGLSPHDAAPAQLGALAAQALQGHTALLRLELLREDLGLQDAVNAAQGPVLFATLSREALGVGPELVCGLARRASTPAFSRSYFVPAVNVHGVEVIDLCVPLLQAGHNAGFAVGTLALNRLLDMAQAARQLRGYELSFVEGDGTRLARAGVNRGAGVYQADRVVDVNGVLLQVRVNSVEGHPGWIPNLTTALVMGLSLALFVVVVLLARDVRRRASAEAALAQALAFRKAMEDSLITGLRARDLNGAITYVNPAFCTMVGFDMHQLMGPLPPYWPPEHAEQYAQRQARRLDDIIQPGQAGRGLESREGFESVFLRSNGERFPVMVYEAPLVDGHGAHTGWMSAVVDLSAQRRIEEISRQQQDRLQATARLATVGEMASLLSHELNQPLAAIASYASGSLNLLTADVVDNGAHDKVENPRDMLLHALRRIEEQAERAGRVIKSVHDFVRRREQLREPIGADLLVQSVMPLVQLQARKSGARIVLDLPTPAPRVMCDRTMLEQVLLNLTRNGIQAMEADTPLAERVLTLRVRQTTERIVSFFVSDAGPGITDEIAQRLFTPFFTTKVEGMGLGLSLCRTVIEQHGGQLDHASPASQQAWDDHGQTRQRGTTFRFTLATPAPLGAATEQVNVST